MCFATLRLPVESNFCLEGRIHTRLIAVNHRVFWPIQGKLERHTGGIRKHLRRHMIFLIGGVGEENNYLRFIP